MKWRLIEEARKTPSNMESINSSFNKDVSDEKFIPTVDFVKSVYRRLNQKLFGGRLPSTNEFKVEIVSSNEFNGNVTAHDIKGTENIAVVSLQINGTSTLTIHTWMETILHEMIHIDDLVNHPEHFHTKGYRKHGKWFKEQARKFKKEGLT